MLGLRIKAARRKQGLTRSELTANAKISVDRLAAIENGAAASVDRDLLLRIIDGLALTEPFDFVNLMHVHKYGLRFRAFNVGLAKSGTTAVTRIFGNFRSFHEWEPGPVIELIRAFDRGKASAADLKQLVLEREMQVPKELESAYYLHYLLEVLVEAFPWAHYIFTIRDCYSWLDSVLNMLPGSYNDNLYICGVAQKTPWQPSGDDERDLELVTPAIVFWTRHNQAILEKLPPDRSLVVGTHEIQARIPELARFVGIPPGRLVRGTDRNPAVRCLGWLGRVDPQRLQAVFDTHAGGLMAACFPGYRLRDFLAGQAPPPVVASWFDRPVPA